MNDDVPQKNTWEPLAALFFLSLLSLLFFKEIVLQTHWLGDDFFTQNFPNRYFAAAEIRSGSLPLWNPFMFSGTPFLADIQTAVLYPFNLILSLFVKNGELSYLVLEWQVLFHFILGGLFTYLFLRSLELDFAGALLGGGLFVFSGYLFSHAHHTNLIHSVIWLPAIFYCCVKASTNGSIWLWAIPLLLTMSFFGGHPQITLFIIYAFSLFFLAHPYPGKYRGNLGRRLLILILIGGAFVLLSLVQILPTVEFLQHTDRGDLTFLDAVKDSLPAPGLLNLFLPDLFSSSYDPWQRWEFRCYVGIGTLILAILGIVLRLNATAIFFAGLGFGSFVLALGEHTFFYSLVYHLVPGFKYVRVPARFLFLFAFSLSVLAAYGFHYLCKGVNTNPYQWSRKKSRVTAYTGGVFLAGVSIFIFAGLPVSEYKNHLTGFLILTTASILTLLMVIRYQTRFPGIKWIVFLMVFLDLFLSRGLFNLMPAEKNYFYNAIHKSPVAQALKDQPEGTRFLVRYVYPIYNNLGLIYRKSNLWGYNPFMLKDYTSINVGSPKTASLLGARFVELQDAEAFAKTWKDVNVFKIYRGFFLNEQTYPRAYFVRHSDYDPTFDLQTRLDHSAFDPLQTVYLNRIIPAPKDYQANAPIQYTITNFESGTNEISLDLQHNKDGFLVLNEIFYPGWRVYVDGLEREPLKANGLFRAVQVEAPASRVQWVFQPRSFVIGGFVSLITLSAMILIFIRSSLKRRSGHDE